MTKGSELADSIARRARCLGVFCPLLRYDDVNVILSGKIQSEKI